MSSFSNSSATRVRRDLIAAVSAALCTAVDWAASSAPFSAADRSRCRVTICDSIWRRWCFSYSSCPRR
ncbi:hypothetical protein [Nonomuraea recticatena]|uniref:hypothetical protein n=1 Tax=Nonomuraea recticatena TaxID=46178 RepID=UPI00361E2268